MSAGSDVEALRARLERCEGLLRTVDEQMGGVIEYEHGLVCVGNQVSNNTPATLVRAYLGRSRLATPGEGKREG